MGSPTDASHLILTDIERSKSRLLRFYAMLSDFTIKVRVNEVW